jgi:hypothetical protein
MEVGFADDRVRARRGRFVMGSLLYLEASREKPFVSLAAVATGETNAVYKPHVVPLRDARPLAETLSLDVQGFELATHVSSVADFYDEAEVETVGRAEAARLVERATSASRVVVFDHTRRRRAPDAPRQPSLRVHNDYTKDSAPKRVRDLLEDEADDLLRRRVAFINVWRPIRHPAADWPLALCDARSVAAEDLVATDIIYPDRSGEIYAATYSPAHRWFYVPNQQLDEALLLKCYDSRADVARFVPHTSFDDPLTPDDAPPRESIEFRTIAFFDEAARP